MILYDSGCRFLVIGNGTNILADDRPIDMIAVKTCGGLGGIRLTGESELTAECGALLSKLAAAALEHGLTGWNSPTAFPALWAGRWR
jgi:UDP-N-acetylmuramate dehydrogenase